MKIGTRSLLFGIHAFWLHPWFVAWGWWRLYGFPCDPRIWVAFFVHDLGYWGKPNMDGPEGEEHVILGAQIMSYWFDWRYRRIWFIGPLIPQDTFVGAFCNVVWGDCPPGCSFYESTALHSRFWAKRTGKQVSKLFYADKLAMYLYPTWLCWWLGGLSGETKEYMLAYPDRSQIAWEWIQEMQEICRKLAYGETPALTSYLKGEIQNGSTRKGTDAT